MARPEDPVEATPLIGLICTVGNRDLEIDGQSAADRGQTMREMAADILGRYDELRDRLTAPMIERSVRYLRDVDEFPDQLVLVVTDRPEGTPYRENDTCSAGEVVARCLRERYGIAKTFIKRLQGVPASVDAVMGEVSRWFPKWNSEFDRIFLVTTGGTPAMATAMLLCALECCPDKVTPLYVPLGGEPRPMDVIRRVLASNRRDDLAIAVAHERFGAALEIMPPTSDGLGVSPAAHRALQEVLAGADQRLRFDLAAAHHCLALARREAGLSEHAYQRLVELQHGLPEPGDAAGLLGELFHNAWQQCRHEEYADFALRLFNFQQAALRLASERAAVRFSGKGEFIASEWLEGERAFADACAAWIAPDGTTGLEIRGGRATGPILLCLVHYLAGTRQLSPAVYEAAARLQRVADLRNRSFAAHDFDPVRRADLEQRFGGSLDEMRDTMRELYCRATGKDLGADPFELTQELCRTLLG